MLDKSIYKLFFEHSSEGFLITNNRAVIEHANKRVLELFGYSDLNEIVGQPVEVLIPTKKRHSHVKQRNSYIENPSKRQMGSSKMLFAQRKNGDTFPVEIGLNHYTHNGEKKVIALITDITQRKIQEDHIANLNKELEEKVIQRTKELKTSQILHQQIARNFPNGTINVFNKELRYIFVEGSKLYKRGITSSQLIGKLYIDLLPEEIGENIQNQLTPVFDGKNVQFDIQINDSFYQINAVPLESEEGIQQILVVENDITKEKIAEKKLEASLVQEKELNELKSRFVSMASHEFRTPLSTISSSATLIGKYQLSEQQPKRDKHVDRIKNAVSNMVEILNDFLSISKLEEGVIEANFQILQLDDLLFNVCEEMKSHPKNGQDIQLNIKQNCTILSDEKLLRNVMYNLLSNAIKYSFPDTQIVCDVRDGKNEVVISITNEGIGIPKADQKNLFTRFFRAGNANNIEGTGLGLNIVKKYVMLLGGEISFESVENEFTTFTVELPKGNK